MDLKKDREQKWEVVYLVEKEYLNELIGFIEWLPSKITPLSRFPRSQARLQISSDLCEVDVHLIFLQIKPH